MSTKGVWMVWRTNGECTGFLEVECFASELKALRSALECKAQATFVPWGTGLAAHLLAEGMFPGPVADADASKVEVPVPTDF